MKSQTAYPLPAKPSSRTVIPATVCLALACHSPVLAQDQTLRLQGFFCNTEAQIDEALGHMSQGKTPRAAAALTNRDEVVCTYVDEIQYLVEHPEEIWQNKSAMHAAKYKATLAGILVGGRLRPISPPVEIFFAVPDHIASALIERPT